MRHVVLGLGVFAVIVGAVWVGQGANLIPGSVMTGDPLWLMVGIVVLVVGLVMVVRSVRASTRPPR